MSDTGAARLVRVCIAGVLLLCCLPAGLAHEVHGHAYRCGYIRLDLEHSVFAPDFVDFLLDAYGNVSDYDGRDGISAADMQQAVQVWNRTREMHLRGITYHPPHFARMLWLEQQLEGSGARVLGREPLVYLSAWSAYRLPEPPDLPPPDDASAEVRLLDRENNPLVRKSVAEIAADPVGYRLVQAAAERGLFVQARPLRGVAASCYPEENRIAMDPTVAAYPFKLNFLAHELVHMVNPGCGNSLVEEVLAEFIGMDIQDRVMGVPMSCHPYVVFVDTLLDPWYAKLPLANGIEEHLEAAGIQLWPLPGKESGQGFVP